MEKRYQVFVSSTFADLLDERRAVMQALLELNCIPAGMELFPASDDDAWTLIKGVIDDCDYYLVMLAGRYGSMDANGVSYTEKEYDYAVAAGKPVLVFLHAEPESIPAKHTDRDPELQRKLAAFRAKVQERKHCRFWRTPHELGAAVTISCVRLFKTRPADGWVQAKYVRTTEDAEKVANLLEQIRSLERELEVLRRLGVADTSGLAQGEDPVRLEYDGGESSDDTVFVDTTWNEVFAVVGKACLTLPSDGDIESALSGFGESVKHGSVLTRCIDMVKTQFICLGLIRIISQLRHYNRPVYTPGSTAYVQEQSVLLVWDLTDYGRLKLGELIGAKRPPE